MTAVFYPQANLCASPELSLKRGEGIYVYDDAGQKYIEGLSGLWCAGLGHANEELIEAATEQMRTLSFAHMFLGKTHDVGIQLAEKLAAMVPVKNAKIFFGNSGSDANDSILKFLRYYANATENKTKTNIISRKESYHGVTLGAAALTGMEHFHKNFNVPIDAIGVHYTDSPYYFRHHLPGESEAQFVARVTDNLEVLIQKLEPQTIAAFIAEPITGGSGVIVPPVGYYESVQEVLKKYDILFWADEVITGFGRTGSAFGCETMNIKSPDIMTFAKQLSSAYVPFSAVAIRGDIFDAIADHSSGSGSFGHGFTYSGHPVACAVALKTLEIMVRDNLFEHADCVGEYMLTRLKSFLDHPLVGDVRGRGLIAAVELVANKAPLELFTGSDVGGFAVQACLKQGLIVRSVAGNCIGLCPPLITSKGQIDEIINMLGRALDDVLNYVNSRQSH